MQKLEDDIKAVISEQLGIKASEISNSKSFVKDLRADSMDMVALLMIIEERLNITIEDKDAEQMETVQDVVSYVSGKFGSPQ